ncbi:MAG: SH3 domain-containing protein [Bdellovibrionaceae bacterium]|nr:SH3 domain-containing protein [Pseudobdellovibrionaceae bacterium]
MRVSLISIFAAAIVWLLPGLAMANPVCVKNDRANLRAGPGTNFKVTWTVGKYMPFWQTGGKGQWLKVRDLDGEEHWVLASMVSSRLNCVVVKSKYANLRRSPAGNAPLAEIPYADRYTPFKKLERRDAWLRVEDDYRQVYWVADANFWWPVKRVSVGF